MAVIKGPGKLNSLYTPTTSTQNTTHPLLKYIGKELINIRGLDIKKCKYCDHLKPLRTHHCSICRTCIIKMDHHCRIL